MRYSLASQIGEPLPIFMHIIAASGVAVGCPSPPHIIRTMSANGHYFNVFPYNNGQEAQYPIPLVFLGTPKIGEPNVAQLKGLFASFQEESLIISNIKKAQYSLCSEMDKQNKYLVKGTVYEKMKFSQ